MIWASLSGWVMSSSRPAVFSAFSWSPFRACTCASVSCATCAAVSAASCVLSRLASAAGVRPPTAAGSSATMSAASKVSSWVEVIAAAWVASMLAMAAVLSDDRSVPKSAIWAGLKASIWDSVSCATCAVVSAASCALLSWAMRRGVKSATGTVEMSAGRASTGASCLARAVRRSPATTVSAEVAPWTKMAWALGLSVVPLTPVAIWSMVVWELPLFWMSLPDMAAKMAPYSSPWVRPSAES